MRLTFIMLCLSPALYIGGQPAVIFSHERGFYDHGFELTLSAGSSHCLIKYTFDGSDPRFSADAMQAAGEVRFFVDPYRDQGRVISPGFIVRACAIDGVDTGRVETHTYIFPSEIKYQREVSGELAPYWPTEHYVPNTFPEGLLYWMQSYAQEIYLRVDPSVVHKPEYFNAFEDALTDIPTFSLVTDPASLFHDSSGIYINATWSGRAWERPGSLELITDGGGEFQVNTGIRIRGGWSCRGDFPKHAFRLFFREEYGDAKLEYPLFGDYGTDRFDKIDLRSSQNNSWHVPGGNAGADFIRDLYAREIQGDMEEPYTRSEYYHLFLNGMYWGLFQTQERPEARYAASYFGGDKDDYDVAKSSGPSYDYPPYTLEATDGNLNSSYELWRLAKEGFSDEVFNRAQGLNPDGSPNGDYPVLLDVENLIDYIIIIYFIGNYDGPASLSSSEARINNFFAIYDRINPDGFKYFVHDAESSMAALGHDITQSPVIAGEDSTGFNPMWLHLRLLENAEYRQAFADRAYSHLFGNGVLNASNCINRYDLLASKINRAVIGESARWGYVRPARPYTKYDTWDPVVDWFLNNYFPNRTNVVIGQFTDRGWLNSLMPPATDPSDFSVGSDGDMMLAGNSFVLNNPNSSGEIYYCLDGSDPRAPGGAVSDKAMAYINEIEPVSTCFLKARILDGQNWSPLTDLVILTHSGEGLIFSEISYDLPSQVVDTDTLTAKGLEFIELKNTSGTDLPLEGYSIGGGVQYVFPAGINVPNDSLIVIAADTSAFRKFYDENACGPFTGSLNNGGESLRLKNPGGRILAEVAYNTDDVWYPLADGTGFTLVYSDYEVPQEGGVKDDWRISSYMFGSPGEDDPVVSTDPVFISEVLANSEYPYMDAIELYNPGTEPVDISLWFLSDEKDDPGKWQVPAGTSISAGSYYVFYEGHYVSDTLQYADDEFGSSFSISSAGERIYLYSGNDQGGVLRAIDDIRIPPTHENTSFGDYTSVSGTVHEVNLEELYFGTGNTLAFRSPVIFREIMYNPAGDNVEFLVLKNRTDSVVNLYFQDDTSAVWGVSGIGFDFPSGISLDPGDSLFLVEKLLPPETFRVTMDLGSSVQVFNYPGKLRNSSERICLQSPVPVGGDSSYYVRADLECIVYDDSDPWPASADGDGYALQRIGDEDFGNDPANWTVRFAGLPDAHAGENRRVRVGTQANLDGTGSEDPRGLSLSYAWAIEASPEGGDAALADADVPGPEFTPDLEGTYTFSLRVSNGDAQSAPSYVVWYVYPNHAPVAGTYPTTYSAVVNETVTLTASGCYDPDYDELFYEWDLADVPSSSGYSTGYYTGRSFEFTPDTDGIFTFQLTVNDGELYSDPLNVRVRATATSLRDHESLTGRIGIYPNPALRDLYIEYSLEGYSNVRLTFMTMQGKVIAQEVSHNMEPGYHLHYMDLQELDIPAGVYLLRVDTDEFRNAERLIYIP